MKVSRIQRHYDKLDPIERFHLAVAALARDDWVDAEQLKKTCPRRQYQMCDRVFLGRLELLYEFVLVVFADLQRPLWQLALLESLTRPVDAERSPLGAMAIWFSVASSDASTAGCAEVAAPRKEAVYRAIKDAAAPMADRVVGFLGEMEQVLRAQAAGIAHGFARFCETEALGDPVVAFRAFTGSSADAFERFLGEQPEEELAAFYAEGLSNAWRDRFQQGHR